MADNYLRSVRKPEPTRPKNVLADAFEKELLRRLGRRSAVPYRQEASATPIMDAQVAAGMNRMRNAGRLSGLPETDPYYDVAGVQDVLAGAGQVASAPLTGLLQPVAGPLMSAVTSVADAIPSPDSLLTYKGQPGERPQSMGDAARSALTNIGAGVDAVSDAAGYPRDYGREAAMAGAGLIAGPVLGKVGRGVETVEGLLNKAGYTARPGASTFLSGAPLFKLDDAAHVADGHAAKAARLTAADKKRLDVIQDKIASLEASDLRKPYVQAREQHNKLRPPGWPRFAWAQEFQPPEAVAHYEQIQRDLGSLLRERDSLQKRMATRDLMAPVRAAAETYADKVASMHKNENMQFNAMSVADYNAAPAVKVYKSPTYNGRQSSEYKVILVNGRPAYARKSNHWGKFGTNITDADQAAQYFGISKEEALQLADKDPFGRIGKKMHDWQLIGGKSDANSSQAGYVFLDE